MDERSASLTTTAHDFPPRRKEITLNTKIGRCLCNLKIAREPCLLLATQQYKQPLGLYRWLLVSKSAFAPPFFVTKSGVSAFPIPARIIPFDTNTIHFLLIMCIFILKCLSLHPPPSVPSRPLEPTFAWHGCGAT
jgi:hypothetical protein